MRQERTWVRKMSGISKTVTIMKKNMKPFVLVAAAAMALASCQKNEIPAPEKQDVHFTINAGIEARMPFYERLSFGFLYTQRIEGTYSWSEGRISANLAPVNVLSLSTNYAFSHFGHSWGGAVNLHLPGFGLFAGLDSFAPLLNVTPQYLPVNPINTNLVLGLNFTFGKYQGRYPKKK